YVGSDDNKVYALNPDGTEKWSYATVSQVQSSPAIASDGTIYFGSYNGRLYSVQTGSAGLASSSWPKFCSDNRNTGLYTYQPAGMNEPCSQLLSLKYSLQQNYPNPFNPITSIKFDLPRTGHVELNVYNVQGQKVKALVHAAYSAGSHQVSWDGKDERGRDVGSSVYFYILKTSESTITKRMVLIR
ncbi:PQQ-binding-like beta-propeller repeat protein, partial [bacterium]|nr:PQQ-binding-like beta-propeller repeat protein [bacterium]